MIISFAFSLAAIEARDCKDIVTIISFLDLMTLSNSSMLEFWSKIVFEVVIQPTHFRHVVKGILTVRPDRFDFYLSD